MILNIRKKLYVFYLIVLSIPLFLNISCQGRKQIAYLQNVPDSSNYRIKASTYEEPVIQADDILAIYIQTIDPQNSSVLNQSALSVPSVGASSASTIGSQVIQGFLVDKDGQVELPMIGKIKLGGLSTFRARDTIRAKASHYFKNPMVQVRYANFKITLVGEFSRPGTYTMPSEKVTILDAIGLAGDITIYGRRDNVMLIREEKGKKVFARFNLASTDIFNSEYYYLKQNDIVYVEPNNHKIVSSNVNRTRNITLLASFFSVVIVLLSRIDLFN